MIEKKYPPSGKNSGKVLKYSLIVHDTWPNEERGFSLSNKALSISPFKGRYR